MSITTLPPEVRNIIFNYLDNNDLYQCTKVSKWFQKMASSLIWERISPKLPETICIHPDNIIPTEKALLPAIQRILATVKSGNAYLKIFYHQGSSIEIEFQLQKKNPLIKELPSIFVLQTTEPFDANAQTITKDWEGVPTHVQRHSIPSDLYCKINFLYFSAKSTAVQNISNDVFSKIKKVERIDYLKRCFCVLAVVSFILPFLK